MPRAEEAARGHGIEEQAPGGDTGSQGTGRPRGDLDLGPGRVLGRGAAGLEGRGRWSEVLAQEEDGKVGDG